MSNHIIRHEVTVKAEPATVFEYLTEGEKLATWFPTEATTEANVGGSYRFSFNKPDGSPDHAREGSFTALEKGKRVEYSWSFGAEPTTVRFDIAKNGSGTNVTLEHSGFGNSPESQEARAMHDQGWGMFLKNLSSVVSGGTDLRKEMGLA